MKGLHSLNYEPFMCPYCGDWVMYPAVKTQKTCARAKCAKQHVDRKTRERLDRDKARRQRAHSK